MQRSKECQCQDAKCCFMRFIFLFVLVSAMVGCDKPSGGDDAITSTGLITGMDQRKCQCCWGWIVQIGNDTYKFDKIPSGSTIDLNNLAYPVTVNLTWRSSQQACAGRLIEVISISQ